MSRIGKKIITIPKGVKVEKSGQDIKATGPIGSNQMQCHPKIKVTIDASAETISVVNEKPEERQCKQLHGTMRALIANLVEGVSKGFVKKMQIFGTGYSVKDQGGKLVFQIGFCHTVRKNRWFVIVEPKEREPAQGRDKLRVKEVFTAYQ